MTKIIGLVGLIGCGKDTVGQHLVEHYGFTSLAFADPLKDCLCAIFGWDREMMAGRSAESRAWREQVDEWWARKLDIPHFTPRWAMQNIGTDVMRRLFHDQIWIINTERRILDTKGPVIITDGRFPNEIRMLRRLGGAVYRVKRGTDPQWFETAREANQGDQIARRRLADIYRIHESEWAWIGEELDGSIRNDSTLEQLFRDAVRITGVEDLTHA